TPSIGTSITPGQPVKYKKWVQVQVTNNGTIGIPGNVKTVTNGQSIQFSIYFRPTNATDSSGDILLATKTMNVNGLNARASRTLPVRPGMVPKGLPPGVYKIVAVVDSGLALPQTSTATNSTVSSTTVTAAVKKQTTSGDLVITSATTNLTSISFSGATGTA